MPLSNGNVGKSLRSMAPAIVRQNVIINRQRSSVSLLPVAACFLALSIH
ncbi:MAG: hypothetical protein RBJ76_06900 [Stenomitos frigidus ULC029]